LQKIASSTAGLTIGTSPYDDSLKRRKKGAAVALNRPAVQSYVPYLDMESKTFVEDLLNYGKAGAVPIDPLPMVQRLSLSLAMTINWGVRVPSHQDRLFKEIVEVEEELNRFRSTTGNLQDYIPLLRLNPVNRTSAKAREMRDRRDHYLKTLNDELAEKVVMGTNKPCIQANVIKFKEETLSDVELISISLSVLGGGFETVSNTVQFCMAYLAQHPEIQDKAFEAICEFQGSENPLCDAADDQKCPYVNGLAREALRYFTVIPLSLPRKSIKDIQYNGMHIPEGTTFYMNAMACNHGKMHPFIPAERS
jgi:3-hydroxyphenylacetate 6-hydroxylase